MTERYEAYCIEQGDTIVLKGDYFHVMDISDGVLKDYSFRIMDEEGYMHSFEANSNDMIRVCVNPYAEVD